MRLLNAKKLAEVLEVSQARAYGLMRDGILPVVHLGRQVRVDEDALREFIAGGGCPLAAGWRREPRETREATR